MWEGRPRSSPPFFHYAFEDGGYCLSRLIGQNSPDDYGMRLPYYIPLGIDDPINYIGLQQLAPVGDGGDGGNKLNGCNGDTLSKGDIPQGDPGPLCGRSHDAFGFSG